MMGPVVKVFGLRGGKRRGLLINFEVLDQLLFSHVAVGCRMQRRVRRVEVAEKKTNSIAASESFYFPGVPADDPAWGGGESDWLAEEAKQPGL